VFVPIAFMGGIAGQWFAPFALTIAASVLVSLFVSFSLDPMLSAYWPDPHLALEQRPWLSRVLGRFNRWFDRQAESYKTVIAWALDHRLAMIALAIAAFVGAILLPYYGYVGSGFAPETDESEFMVNVETPPGANLAYTRLKAQEVARLARLHPEVTYTYTTVGGQGDAVDQGNVFVKLVPKNERSRSQSELVDAMRGEMQRLGGVTTAISTGFNDGQKQIQLQLQGDDARELARLADQVMAAVQKVPGAVDVALSTKGQKPELDVQLDRGLAGALGISVGQVAQALRPAFAGYRRRGLDRPVRGNARRDHPARAGVPERRRRPGNAAARRHRAREPADDDSARPGGPCLRLYRPRAYRSPRSRARRHRRREHFRPAVLGRPRRHQRGGRDSAVSGGLRAGAGGRRRAQSASA
jgi:hydrophobic/amphiphilic exporter-1 (mainly G- bacteria), HAE1 family